MWLASGASLHPVGALCIQCSQRLTPGATASRRAPIRPVVNCSGASETGGGAVEATCFRPEAAFKGIAPTHCHMCERQFHQESCQCQCHSLSAESV